VVSRPGRDPAGWLLALAVCLLPPERSDWGRAMNAELSHIDRPLSRWRFAAGCLRATMWQGRLWRVALVVAVQAAAVALALMSPIGGALRAEVIVLAVLAPPALWWIGRSPGLFGRLEPGRAARIGRRGGYALVSGCVVVAAGFVA
jgi:hypothetical protein